MPAPVPFILSGGGGGSALRRPISPESIKETSHSPTSLSPRLQREGLEECPLVRLGEQVH